MKKIITFSIGFVFAVSCLSVADTAEAKRGFSGSRSVSVVRKPASTQKNTQKPQQQKTDADFNTTPPKQTAATQTAQGSSMANFATGALAGYVLSNALSPNDAQAAQNPQENAEKLPSSAMPAAQPQALPPVPMFKSIDANDPFLIEKTSGYLRYCLNGVQYLISTANTQLPPTLMVDKNNAPAQCLITP